MATPSELAGGTDSGGAARLLVRLFRTYARPFIGLIALVAVLSVAGSGARYLRAYLIKPIFDDVLLPAGTLGGFAPEWLPRVGDSDRDESLVVPDDAERVAAIERHIEQSVVEIGLWFLLVVFAMPLVLLARAYLVEYVLGRVYIDLQRDVGSKLLSLPLSFHYGRQRGDVLSRTLADTRTAHSAVGLVFDDFLEALTMAVVGVSMLFFVSWQLATIFLAVGPLLFAVIALFTRRIRRSARRRQETYGAVAQRLIEILAGIKVIKAFNAESAEDAAFREQTDRLFRRSMRVVRSRVVARSLVEMLNNAIAIGTIFVGMLLVLSGRWGLSPGDLAAFAAVLATTYRPVRTLARGWVRLVDAEPSAERLFEVLDSPIEIEDAPDAVSLAEVRRGIAFREVSFSYGREPVLHDISLEIAAGEVVALVGPTGSGKTTLVDLLLRFHDPQRGRIEIDGVDLRQLASASLRRHIAVVSQEPFLFDGSIRDNIRYGRPDASDADVLEAARAAHVDEFAEALDEGYETEVGAEGVRLSGGQRQRITIARAILKDPSILVFDEATSSLDSKSERYVQEAVERLLAGRTVLLVAHRLSTVRRADRIVVLDRGRITERGSHAELVSQGGLYHELLALQES